MPTIDKLYFTRDNKRPVPNETRYQVDKKEQKRQS